MLTKGLYQFTLQSPDTEELYQYAPLLQDKMRTMPGLVDVNSDLQIKNPQVNVVIDRDKAATLGVSAQQIEDALYYAYGSRQISTIYAPNNEYQVIMELEPKYQMDPAALQWLYVRVLQRPAGAPGRPGQPDPGPGAPHRQPSGAAPGGDHLLQPEAGHGPGRRGGRRWKRWPGSCCRPPSPPVSRARPRPSRPPSRACGSC